MRTKQGPRRKTGFGPFCSAARVTSLGRNPITTSDIESSQLIRNPSVHAGPSQFSLRALGADRHGAIALDAGGDARVTKQTTTQRTVISQLSDLAIVMYNYNVRSRIGAEERSSTILDRTFPRLI